MNEAWSNIREEKWVLVPKWEEYYEVSDTGYVRRVGKQATLKPFTTKRGYYTVTLHGGGNKTTARVHRLVCEAFWGEPDEVRPHVNHRDGDKTNNRADNLEWCSNLENIRHAHRTGLIVRERGTNASKLTQVDADRIRVLRVQYKMRNQDIADVFGVSESMVRRIVMDQSW